MAPQMDADTNPFTPSRHSPAGPISRLRHTGIQLQLRSDSHGFKSRLIALLATPRQTHQPGTGLRKVANLVQDLYSEHSKLENTSNQPLTGEMDMEISTD